MRICWSSGTVFFSPTGTTKSVSKILCELYFGKNSIKTKQNLAMIDQTLAFLLLLAFFIFKHVFILNCLFLQTVGFGGVLGASSKGFVLWESTVGSSSPHRSPCSFFPQQHEFPSVGQMCFCPHTDVSIAEELVLLTAQRFLESLLTCRCEVDCSLPLGR